MSARREARRARTVTAAVSAAGGVPVVLLVGPCIEVWADPAAEQPPFSAMRRFSVVWSWWLEGAGVESRERCQIIPTGNPWSAAYLVGTGRLADRLARAGVTVDDLPQLALEAQALHDRATDARLNRNLRKA